MLFTAFLFSIMILGPRIASANTVSYDNLTGNGTFSTWDTNPYGTGSFTNSVSGNLEAVQMYLQANISMPFSLTVQLASGHTDAFIDCSATVTMNSAVNNSGNSFVNLITVTGFTGTQCAMGTGAGDYEFRFPVPTGGTSVGRGRQTQGNTTPLIVYTQYSAGPPPDLSTHIIDFAPGNNATTTNPVTFSLNAYVSPNDLGTFIGVKFTLHNIDQNVLLLSAFSPSDIYLLDGFQATTSGNFNFSTTTIIGEGNYRLEAQIERSYLGGWFVNPFSPINEDISHQFIVCGVSDPACAGTFIGNLSQNGYNELNSIFASSTATTTASAANCNFTSWNTFSLPKCGAYLLVPGGDYLNTTLKGLKDGVLTRVPWGYFTRAVAIFNTTATSSLPTFTATIQIGPGDQSVATTTTLTFDPGDMIAGGGALLDSITDPIHGKTVKDVFEPLVQLSIAISVLFTIIADLTGSHRHHTDTAEGEKKKKLS